MKKRNLIYRISMLVVIMTMVASCKKESSEYINAIPADVSALVGINIQSLVDKSGVNDSDKQKLIDAIKGEFDAATFQHVEKIIKDGSESGLSVKDPVYIFTSDLISAAVVMKVSNRDKLNKSLEIMIAEQIAEPVTKVNGIDIVKLADGGVCAFNESTFVVIADRNGEEVVTQLMKQTSENSIAHNLYYKSMSSKEGDIMFFTNLDALARGYMGLIDIPYYYLDNVNLAEIALVGGLSFDKGKISLRTEMMSVNEEFAEMMRTQYESYGKINNTFLSYFPASTLVYASLNVNGGKLFDALMANEQLRSFLDFDDAKMMRDVVFRGFDGDCSFGLTNITMNDMPTFVAYAQAKNGEALDAIYKSKDGLGLSGSENLTKTGNNEYAYKTTYMTIYFGFKDNFMYVTNSESVKKNIGNKEKNSLKDSEYASNMMGKYQYVVVDMKAILDLPLVKMATMMGGEEVGMILNMAAKVSYLEIVGNADSQSDINLWLVDRNTNALKQIVDMAKVIAGV